MALRYLGDCALGLVRVYLYSEFAGDDDGRRHLLALASNALLKEKRELE